jgi:hypothetical protein
MQFLYLIENLEFDSLDSTISYSESGFQNNDIKFHTINFKLQCYRFIRIPDYSRLSELAIQIYTIEAGFKVAENRPDSIVVSARGDNVPSRFRD